MLTPPKVWHLETLQKEDLDHLIKRRVAVYDAMKSEHIDAKELAKLFEMMLWLTEQIVYLKGLRR